MQLLQVFLMIIFVFVNGNACAFDAADKLHENDETIAIATVEEETLQYAEYTKVICEVLKKYRFSDCCMTGKRLYSIHSQCFSHSKQIQHLDMLVKKKQKIQFLLLAFPFKAPSRNLTIGDIPDMAERVAFEFLEQIMQELSTVYPYGVELVIVNYGHLVRDVFNISLEKIEQYEKDLVLLSKDLKWVHVVSIQDYLKLPSVDAAIQVVENIEPPTFNKAKQIISENYNLFRVYSARISTAAPNLSRDQLHINILRLIDLKRRANKVLKAKNPDMIRISVHPQREVSHNLCVPLCDEASVPPWSGALVERQDGSYAVLRNEEVDTKLYELSNKMINGVSCAYYRYKSNTKASVK